MPTDPRHGRFVPVARPFAAVLRRVLRRQAIDGLAYLRRGVLPPAGIWDEALAVAAETHILDYLWMGVRMLWESRPPRPRPAGGGPPRRPPPRTAAAAGGMEWDFRWVHPEVTRSARTAAYRFAESTNRTSRLRIAAAREKLGEELARGLEKGDPVTLLSARVGRIFSAERALTIAATEASRAMHDGRGLAARAAGVWGKEWLASEDACEECLAVERLGPIPLEQPFRVEPGGGPYAVTMFPPLHPS